MSISNGTKQNVPKKSAILREITLIIHTFNHKYIQLHIFLPLYPLWIEQNRTYINVKITKSNCTISNETCIKCIKIAHGFNVGNEGGHAKHEY